MSNPAFDYLRQFKSVSEETEELVIRKVRSRYPELTMKNVIECFENGLCGEYGDYFSLDPRTLLGWVNKYMTTRERTDKYYDFALISPNLRITDAGYPSSSDEWMKETNKAYAKFLEGRNISDFHPDIYDRLSLDGRIDKDSCTPYVQKNYTIQFAKQTAVGDYFKICKEKGLQKIYSV